MSDQPWDNEDHGPRFVSEGNRKASTMARAYVYAVCAAMLNAQYTTHPENVEGWMFGGIDNETDRQRVLTEIKRLEASLNKRAARLRQDQK